MAGGIAVRVFADLDMAAVAAAVLQMKNVFGSAGKEIGAKYTNDLKAAQDQVVRSANEAARSETAAMRAAVNERIALRKAEAAATVDIAKQTAQQQKAILMAPVVTKQRENADAAYAAATAASGKAADDHAAALDRNAAAASGAAVAFNRAGMAGAGLGLIMTDLGLKRAVDFEAGVTRVGAATEQLSSVQIKQLHDGLLQLSTQYGVSQKDLTDAAYQVQKAGGIFKDVGNDLKFLQSAVEVSKIDKVPLLDVISGGTATINDFNVKAEGMVDVLARMKRAAAMLPSGNLADLSHSLGNIEPQAMAAMGANQDSATQVMAMITRMSTANLSPDRATQLLNNALIHIMNPNGPQAEYLGGLLSNIGMKPSDLALGLNQPGGMINAFQTIGRAVKASTNDQGQVVVPIKEMNQDLIDKVRDARGLLHDVDSQHLADLMLANLTGGIVMNLDQKDNLSKQVFKLARLDPEFRSFLSEFTKANGGSGTLTSQRAVLQSPSAAWAQATGSQSGDVTGLLAAGSSENIQKTLDVYKQLGNETADVNGNIKGWDQVLQTASQKLAKFKAEWDAMWEKLGETVLPEFKKLLGYMSTMADFLGHHQAILQVILSISESIAFAWGAGKILGAVSGVTTALGLAKTRATELNTTLATTGTAASSGASGVNVLVSRLGAAYVIAKQIQETVWHFFPESDPNNQKKDWWHAGFGPLADLWDKPGNPPGMMGGGSDFDGNPVTGTTSVPSSTSVPSFLDPGTGQRYWWETPGAKTNPNAPQGPLDTSLLEDQKKGGKGRPPLPGITDPSQVQMPDGTAADPLFVDPASGFTNLMGSGPGTGDPFSQFSNPKGLWGKHGLFGDVAGLMTTFLAELAMGNPFGFLQLEKGGKGKNMFGKAEESSNRLANAFDRVNEALARGYGPGTPQYDIAARNYDNAKISAGKYGVTSPSGASRVSGAPSGYTQDQAATAIIAEAQRRGLNKEQTLAALTVGLQETNLGANSRTNDIQNQNGTPGIQGLFQQDNSYNHYGDKTNPAVGARGFIDQFLSRGYGGGDPYAGAAAVQSGIYGAGDLRARRGAAEDFYNRNSWFGNIPGNVPGGGQSGPGGFGADFFGAGGSSGFGGFPLSPGGGRQPKPWDNNSWFKGGSRRSTSVNQSIGGFDTGASKAGFSISGLTGTAGALGAMAADAFAPGSGAAVQIAMQEANRAAQTAGEAAAVMAGEFPLETFFLSGKDLSGKNVNMANSFIGKVAGGLIGSHSTSSNGAGMLDLGKGMDPNKTNPAMKKADNKDPNTKDGNNNNYGVHMENVNIHNGQGMDDLVKEQNRGLMTAPGSQGISRSIN